jgi:hypothetical protein
MKLASDRFGSGCLRVGCRAQTKGYLLTGPLLSAAIKQSSSGLLPISRGLQVLLFALAAVAVCNVGER